MTAIVLKEFSGELPNIPAYMLPDKNAQQALNCDFAQKDLRPLRDGFQVAAMSNNIKGIYSEDGLKFFSWPIETYAHKSPTIGDTFGRVYFMNANGFNVAQVSTAQNNGGEPSSSWTVGVPAPTVAPVLTAIDLNQPKSGAITYTGTAWYELDGVKYGSATVGLVSVYALKNYYFAMPTRAAWDPNTSTGVPDAAKLVLQLTVTQNAKTVALINITAGAANPTKNSAFPGSQEYTLNTMNGIGFLDIVWGVYETRAYVFTVTNTFGEESAPSPAATIDITFIQDVKIETTLPSFTGYRPYSSSNIYRTFGSSGSFVKVPVSTYALYYQDSSYKASEIGVSLPSLEWYAPTTGMFGLTPMPGGYFAAFKDNILYFSEPYRPHAWPYSMSFPKNIRGICRGAQSLVVTTADACYVVVGSSPKNAQQMLLPIPQAGVTHRSMTMLEGGVAFASNDGIVYVSGSQATLDISQKFFSREDWRARYSGILSDIRFAYHDGFLVAVSSTTSKGFIVRMDEATGTFSQYNWQYAAAFYLPLLDTLYYSIGNTLYRFRAGSYHTLDWWSKDFILGKHTNFGAAYIRCSGSVTVTLYADGAQWHQFTATSSGYYRLPAGNKALKWSVRFQTANRVEEFAMAEAMSELRNV